MFKGSKHDNASGGDLVFVFQIDRNSYFATYMTSDAYFLNSTQFCDYSERKESPRKEFLISIDPISLQVGTNQFPGIFDTRVYAGIRRGDWKLITGNPGAFEKKFINLHPKYPMDPLYHAYVVKFPVFLFKYIKSYVLRWCSCMASTQESTRRWHKKHQTVQHKNVGVRSHDIFPIRIA